MLKDYKLTNSQDLVSNSEYVASYVTYTSQDRNKSRLNVEIIKTNPIVTVVVLNEHNELAVLPCFNPAIGSWFYEAPFRSYTIRENILEVSEETVKKTTGLQLVDAMLLTQGPNYLNPKTNTNMQVVFGRVQTFLNKPNTDVCWLNLKEAYYRLKRQLKYNQPFMDDMYLGGITSDALRIYKFVEE